MLFCGKCQAAGRQSRIIYTQANGRGGTTYEYFFCRARQEGACDLPYIPAHIGEDRVIDTYGDLQLDPDFEADFRARLEAAMEVEQGETKAMRSSLAKQLREIELKEFRLIDLAAEGLLDASKIRRKVHELAVQKSRVEDTLVNVESQIALGAELLSKALDQLSDPRNYYLAAPDKVRPLLNESFYQHFFVSEDGGVVGELDPLFGDILNAQTAFSATNPETPGFSPRSSPPSRQRAIQGVSGVLSRQFEDNENGADSSTPSL